MKHDINCLALVAALLFQGFAIAADKPESLGELDVASPPRELKLDPFYKKYVSSGGVSVVGSGRVSDYAMLEAAYIWCSASVVCLS